MNDFDLPWAIVRLDDPCRPAGPATIVEVLTHYDTKAALAPYRDRDGCLSDDIRLWRIGAWAKPGGRCSLGMFREENQP